jgi:hypothetical protein
MTSFQSQPNTWTRWGNWSAQQESGVKETNRHQISKKYHPHGPEQALPLAMVVVTQVYEAIWFDKASIDRFTIGRRLGPNKALLSSRSVATEDRRRFLYGKKSGLTG